MIREARLLAIVLAFGSALVLVAAVAPSMIEGATAERLVRMPFRLLCHGIVSRSLAINGEPMSLCARCSGIFGGLIAGSLLSLALAGRSWMPGISASILVLPLVLDGATQAMGLRESWNTLRLVTGFIAGTAAIGWALASIARNRGQIPVALP